MRASKLQPVLLGGLFIGVLSALPIVNLGNCLCCLWVVSGGLLAAWLLQQAQPTAIGAGDGAIVGLLAGLVGAVVGTALEIPIHRLTGSMGQDILQQLLAQSGDMPSGIRELLEQAAQAETRGAMIVFGLAVAAVVNAIFGTLGGLLGATLVRPSAPAPPPPVPGFADSGRTHGPEKS